MNEADYATLTHRIRRLLGVDIDAYKSQQMRRRLESFVSRNADGEMSQLLSRLDTDAHLLTQLRNMLTINVSQFFRDVQQFNYLRSTVLPELLERNAKINVWSAGCSHGEEPYSVAITLAGMSSGRRARIIATDLNREALKRAQVGGPYLPNEIRNVSERQLQRYFTSSDEGHVVADEIRKRLEFREHDLLSDEFERGVDLLICRYVMIYFSREVRSKLLRKSYDSLKPGGVLFIGGAEALLGADGEGFERLAGNFYRKSGAAPAGKRWQPVATSASS